MPSATAEKRRINQHITNLDNPDEKVSARAEDYLIRYYGDRALEPLLDACQHPKPVVRYRAVWALGFTHDPRAYETILRLTGDPDEGVRYDATIALGILGDERAIEPLIEMCLKEDATCPAADGLSRMGLKATSALIEILRQGGPNVRWSAVQVLGNFAKEFGDRRCIDLLQACVNDPNPEVRENAEFWLNDISNGEPDIAI